MITFILLAVVGILVICGVVLAYAVNSRKGAAKSAAQAAASSEPKQGRATGTGS